MLFLSYSVSFISYEKQQQKKKKDRNSSTNSSTIVVIVIQIHFQYIIMCFIQNLNT